MSRAPAYVVDLQQIWRCGLVHWCYKVGITSRTVYEKKRPS